MNVALVFPPLYGVDFPHLGLAYVAAKLLEDNHNVKIFCFNLRLYKENSDKKSLWDWSNSSVWQNYEEIKKNFPIDAIGDKWVNEVLQFDPEIVGFSVNNHSKIISNLLAKKIKKKNGKLTIIFGGPFCSELSEEDLNPDMDVYVKGEGEIIASLLLRRLSQGEPIGDIKGIIFKEKGTFKYTGDNDTAASIDNLHFPALELFDFGNYDNKREIPIIFSRGCNYYCRFCSDRPIWGRYRMRSAENIVQEMKKNKKIFGRSAFKCNDLLINGDLNELERLTDLIIKESLNITWGGMARARADMSDELLLKLKKSGCAYLTFGIESGSNRLLKFMGKPNIKDTTITIRRTHNAGIKVNTLWMIGHPRESFLDVLKTIIFLFRNRKFVDEFVNVSLCYIPRNSLLDLQSKKLGIEYDQEGNWYIKKDKNSYKKRKIRAEILKFFAKLFGLYTGGIRSDY